MENLVLASTQADAKAAELIIGHHAEMDATLGLKAELVATAARTAGHAPAEEARLGLHRWCRDVLVPHAMAAEATLCRAGGELPDGRLLVEAMVVEHRIIGDLVETIAQSDDAIDTALAASALRHLFTAHLTKVNDQLVPLLVREPSTSLRELLDELEAHFAAAGKKSEQDTDDGYGHPVHAPGECGCGERDVSSHPELDARAVPHAIRHATVFGALDAVRPGRSMVLVAPHDPLPLLRQLEGRQPGVFEVDYLQRGPDAWRLLLTRRDS
jgi:uncharacterized protein (DUF2249 family)